MKTVREVMTKNPAVCLATDSLQEVAKLMLDRDCGEIPVVKDRESMTPIGVITDRDICCRAVAGGHDVSDTVQAFMSSPVIMAEEEMGLEECLNLMEVNQIRRLPVVDHEDRCCGIIAQADLARHLDQTVSGELLKYVSEQSPKHHSQLPGNLSQ
jgi:CBS domain-containing protein